jgi:hypothetical protein
VETIRTTCYIWSLAEATREKQMTRTLTIALALTLLALAFLAGCAGRSAALRQLGAYEEGLQEDGSTVRCRKKTVLADNEMYRVTAVGMPRGEPAYSGDWVCARDKADTQQCRPNPPSENRCQPIYPPGDPCWVPMCGCPVPEGYAGPCVMQPGTKPPAPALKIDPEL